ncbi:hypothetical protein [Oricola cellulosilytica]|uniref:Uncharacterized protein n=1 Tax=Oricola cellulosilytica TaxID=1429082 RepID=A0A4R0PAZ4_9HYPH|nr:hypothetical protein [Oricola cellulosilytica]TCD13465.1 hypothetical protein E0D97_13380 [Oricola cellulosilytica]
MRAHFMTAFFLYCIAGSGAQSAEIDWTVDQPFRFLRFKSDHLIHEMAFDDASTLPSFRNRRVSLMESLLNDPAWWESANTTFGGSPRNLMERLRGAEKRTPESVDARLGWSSLLLNRPNAGIYEATCWNALTQSFYFCQSDEGGISGPNEYAIPRHHFVTVRVAQADPDTDCTLIIETPLTAKYGFLEDGRKTQSRESAEWSGKCADPAVLRIRYGEAYTLSGTADGEDLEPEVVEVRDILIASMGDSFSSGEGNPDLPATLDPVVTVKPRYEPVNGGTERQFGVPRRLARPDGSIAEFSSARWLDRRCHRSMYSAHTRAAIALALSGDRRHAVTYMSVSCSGAEITDGVFWPQDGRECTTPAAGGTRYLQPQISALVGALGQEPGEGANYRRFPNRLEPADRYFDAVLDRLEGGTIAIRNDLGYCNIRGGWPGLTPMRRDPYLRTAGFEREIDLLMLSIGGNDMGFAPLVTSIVLRSGFTDTLFGDLMSSAYATAAGGIDLNDAQRNINSLDGRYEMLAEAIGSKLEIDDPGDVLITAYPSPAFDENGRLCDSGRLGMNASRFFDLAGPGEPRGKADIAEAQDIVEKLNEKIGRMADRHGFTYIDGYSERFRKHGLCAARPGSTAAAEEFDLPHKLEATSEWQGFDPVTDFRPYAKRQRWFRTFNDSYLAMYHFKGHAYDERPVDTGNAMYLAFRTLGGPVHPSAEGHAAIADEIYCAAALRLFPDQPDALCD